MLATFSKKINHSLSFSKVHLTINNKECIGTEGETVLQLLKKNQIQIPSLCEGHQSCQLSKVLINGEPKLACSMPVQNGMNINTKSESINQEVIHQISKLPKNAIIDNLIDTIKDKKHKPTHLDNTTNSI